MRNKLLHIFFLLCFCTLGIGQANTPLENGTLRRARTHCINNPEKSREIIYEYSNGRLFRTSRYSNTLLTIYEELQYNQFGNEEKQVHYDYYDDIVRIKLSTYDSKQRLVEEKTLNKDEELQQIFEYDSLSRIIAEKYFRDPYEPNISCYYFLYEYSGENLVRKSFYQDCSLRSYELNIYDERNRKIKTEFYSHGSMSKYILYTYNDSILTGELTYSLSRGTRLISEKIFVYNGDKQLIEIIADGKLIKRNHYENKRLIRTENYAVNKLQRLPAGICSNNVVEYEYYK